MFRSLFYKFGATLKRTTTIINGESYSLSLAPPSAKYFSRIQNQNVVISNSRVVTSTFSSFSTSSCTDSDTEFVVSYLISSCGLSETEAIKASEKINFKTKTKPDFKTTSNPDSVLALLKSYGFTESHISKLINKDPLILLSKPDKTLKPKLDFFKSKGLVGIDLANFISRFPRLLTRGLETELIPSFDTLKSLVGSDENVIKLIQRHSWIADRVKMVMVNVELLRNEGVPETNIRKGLAAQPRAFTVNGFKKNLEKVKEMGFNHLQLTFVIAVQMLASMTEVNWRKKMDVYKRWGWSEDQIQSAFRRNPKCMMVSEKKIMAIMTFLVNEMNYDSSSVANNPVVFHYSLKERIIPRCSVIRVLVSRGFIKENISSGTLATLVDESFLEKFVKKYELQVPGLMKVFKGQLNYQELLQN